MEIKSEVAGTIWKIEVAVGANVAAGETILIVESMKMEIPVDAPMDCVLRELRVAEQEVVKEGQVLAILG